MILKNHYLNFIKSFLSCFLLLINTFSYSEESSYWPTTNWKKSTPEKQGMDSELLADGINTLIRKDVNLHSVLIIRHGYIVADAYMQFFTAFTKHDLASATKSILATLVGAAIQQGYIEDINQKVLSFYPERTIKNNDERKNMITIKNLLTMQSGLECTWNPYEVTFFKMLNSPDWIQFILDLPMASEPGTNWEYNSGSMQILSDIIRRSTGRTALDYAREILFSPLGISDVAWSTDNKNINNTGSCCLRMRPTDLAKIGYLYLNDGIWDGKRILPEGWVTESTGRHAFLENSLLGTTGYGYLWWLIKDGFSAEGRGAQHLYVFPEMDLIVVTTGGTEESKAYEFVKDYVLPAVKSDKELLQNKKSYQNLKAVTAKAASKKIKAVESSVRSDLERQISGKKIILEPNPFLIKCFSLIFKEATAKFKIHFSFDCDRNSPVEYDVGLDGKPRISAGRFGLPAIVSGRWASENIFIIDLNEIGNINSFIIELEFNGNQIHGTMKETQTGLGSISISGFLTE